MKVKLMQVGTRVPQALYDRLLEAASAHGHSLNAEINLRLSESFGGEPSTGSTPDVWVVFCDDDMRTAPDFLAAYQGERAEADAKALVDVIKRLACRSFVGATRVEVRES